MKQIFLEGKKTVQLEDNRVMDLAYYLLENSREDNTVLYGIKITKTIDEYTESEEVDAISYSKEFVQQIIQTLMKNEVTPISMIEIIDEIITMKLCS